MEQHLEIFKHIEELYHGDTTDEAILQYAKENSAKLEMWKEAFAGFYLRDVLDTIDDYFAHKNNKTPPRIAQIKAMLNAANIHAEDKICGKNPPVEPDYDIRYMKLDKENGDMNWLTPHYARVLQLIRQDYWPFVQNIYHPTHEEFRECLKRWSWQKYGREFFCLSKNQIDQMTPEQKKKVEGDALSVIRGGMTVKTFGKSGGITTATSCLSMTNEGGRQYV